VGRVVPLRWGLHPIGRLTHDAYARIRMMACVSFDWQGDQGHDEAVSGPLRGCSEWREHLMGSGWGQLACNVRAWREGWRMAGLVRAR
jgi:hypothetical protein